MLDDDDPALGRGDRHARARPRQLDPALERRERARHRHHPPGAEQHPRHLARASARSSPSSPATLPDGRAASSSPATTRSSSTARSTRCCARWRSRSSSSSAIIYLFLRDWRATLIPALTIPVALIGTLARDLPDGLLAQHPDAARAGARHRPRRRRRHRRAREHRAPPRPRAWGRAPRRCSAPSRCSSRSSRPPRRSPRSSCRCRSCPARPARSSASSASPSALAVAISALVALSLCPMLASRMLDGATRPDALRAAGPPRRLARARSTTGCCTPRSTRRWSCVDARPVFGVTACLMFAGRPARADPARGPRARCCCGSPRRRASASTTPPRKMREIEERTAPLRALGRGRRARSRSPARAASDNSRLHDLHPGALGRARPRPAGDRRRHRAAPPPQVVGVRAFADPAELARHPRRRAGAAVRHRRLDFDELGDGRRGAGRADGGRTRPSARCGSPTRPPSRSSSSRSTASAPPTSASTSTASARRCRRCSTAARSARSSSTTAATTSS